MMYSLVNGRNQRVKTQMYDPVHNSFANYCTEALQKSEMKLDFENEIFLNNLHLIPDPLKKNLADTLITAEIPEKVKKQSLNTEMPPKQTTEDVRPDSALGGIANFFSGVFSMLSSAMFRTKSPVHYYDCFDESRQGSPSWRRANDDQDKNGQSNKLSSDAPNGNVSQSDMSKCKTTVSSCEDKLKQVRHLLKPIPKPSNPIWLRKQPKKVFVEPGSVEDSFEDAFTPEDFVTLSNDPYIEYHSPYQYQTEALCETDAPKTKLEVAPTIETTEIVKDVTESNIKDENSNSNVEHKTVTLECDKIQLKNTTEESSDDKHQLVSSCEDKLSKLKALLQEKRMKHTKSITPASEPITEQPRPAKTIPINKPIDKHFKNPHRMLDKRRKIKIKRSIQDDVIFANEIDIDSNIDSSPSTPSTINSSDTSLGEYFDEMKGRFRSNSTTESEDSFQIVFNDCPKRCHKASDCESEDSFIVFEDTDCFTTNDVFRDSDSDSDISDSGCSTMTCKLSHSLSRTVSNLTDDTLYESSDEVDCVKVEPVIEAKGLLMNADKKKLRKDLPAKKVHFSTEAPVVKVMRVWAFAARQARVGHWERYALDRDRFKRRIADVDMAVSWVLKPQHRSRVMFQRFMPWWNREKRQALAEKRDREEKQKEEERVEEEKRLEEEGKIEENREEEENTTQKESVPVIANITIEGSKNKKERQNVRKKKVNSENSNKNYEADTKLSSFSNSDEKNGKLKNGTTKITVANIVNGNLCGKALSDKSEIENNNNKVLGADKIETSVSNLKQKCFKIETAEK